MPRALVPCLSLLLVGCQGQIGWEEEEDLVEASSLEADSEEGRSAQRALPEADVLSKCAADPRQWWRGPKLRDITFVAFGDAHAIDLTPGCPRNKSAVDDQNLLQRAAINSVELAPHTWPAGASFYREGKPYDHVRGVVIAGDLTQFGSESAPAGKQVCREYTAFRDTFGRCGDEGKLAFPVYEGYGNHDFPSFAGGGKRSYHPVVEYLDRIGTAHRPGSAADLFDDPEDRTGHYAWRWDDLWFVQVDLKPGYEDEVIDKAEKGTRVAVPHTSRRFLKSFLASRSRSTQRQIVIVSHYPLGSHRITDGERRAFCKVIDDARRGQGLFKEQKLSRTNPVAAFLHGHTHHAPGYTEWRCPSPYEALTIPSFDVGTAFYQGKSNVPGHLHFTIFRFGTSKLEAVGVSAPAKNPTGAWSYLYKRRLDTLNPPD
jgi:cytolysin (calcineurin-like family phosphatase)